MFIRLAPGNEIHGRYQGSDRAEKPQRVAVEPGPAKTVRVDQGFEFVS